MSCKVCNRNLELRMGCCFDCVEFESLIKDKTDMYDKPVVIEIEGSESLNILYKILKKYGLFPTT